MVKLVNMVANVPCACSPASCSVPRPKTSWPLPELPIPLLVPSISTVPDLPSKLLGMQLQVETAALTIFQHVREARVCPVLSDLLAYFEMHNIGWTAWSWADWPHLVVSARDADWTPTPFGELVRRALGDYFRSLSA